MILGDWTTAGPFSNTSWWEISWIVTSVLLLMVSYISLKNSFLDWRNVKLEKLNGILQLITWNAMVRSTSRLGIQATILVFSLSASRTPSNPSPSGYQYRISLICTVLIIQSLTMWSTLTDRHTRKEVIEDIMEKEGLTLNREEDA